MGPGYVVGGVVAAGAALVVEGDGVSCLEMGNTAVFELIEEEIISFVSKTVYSRQIRTGSVVVDGDIV